MIGSGLCSSPSVAGALAVAVGAHTGTGVTEDGGADEGHGGSNWLSLAAASSVASAACALKWLLTVFLPLSRVPALAIGLTVSRPAFAGPGNEVGADTPMQWCYVERGASRSVPYDALWAHWTAMVTPPESRRAGSRLASAPCFAEGDHGNDFIVWGRLQHCTERVTTVLFGGQPAGSVTAKSTRLCALLAVLGDVRACATRQSTSDPLPVLLSDETSVPQRLLFQWFTFLGLRSASSLECRPSVELSTEIHAIVSTRDWLAELSACNSIYSLGHWLHLVSQWLTFRVLEAALELLPSVLRWKTGSASAAETHLLFRADVDLSRCCSAGLCSGPDSTACPAQQKGGFARLRPSCWMRYRTTASTPAAAPPSTASIAAALPELSKAEAALVCVLERLMNAAIGPAGGLRKSLGRSATAHALILEPEAHGVVTCRLHLGSPPPKWERNGLPVRGVSVPPLSHSFVTRQPALSSAPPTARAAHSPVVAALLSWYAVDFEAVFGRLYRVWRLAQRYHSRCPAKSCGEIGAAEAAALHDSGPWRGVVDAAVRCYTDDAGCSGQAHEGPALGSLGRCLLLAIWLSLALVDVDEGVGAAAPCPPVTWKGTLYYSSRRNVLHVRDWGTALHLRHVASCLSAGDDQVMGGDTANAGALQDGNSRGRECGAAVKRAVSTVVNSFARARIAAVAAQARTRLQAQSTTHLTFSKAHDPRVHTTTTSRGAGDSTSRSTCRLLHICGDDGAAAEDDDECVLLSWSCDTAKEESGPREGGSGISLVQPQQGKPRRGGGDPLPSTDPLVSASLHSSWLDYSIEEFAEANDGTIGQPLVAQAPAPQVKEDSEHFALDPALAVPLVELESHLRELLTRNALSEMLSLVGLTGGLAWRTCGNGEVAARQHLASHARSHNVRTEAQRRFGGSGALPVDEVQLHEDEQPPSPAAAHVDVSLLTWRALAALASSKAARLQEDEESTRSALCRAEHRMRQYVHARCTHIGALLLLQSREARGRLHLSQVWDLEQEEWQARWSTVLVPECVLRSLLHEKAAAGAWRALPQQEGLQSRQQHDCRHRNRRLGYASQWHQRGPRGSAASLKVVPSPPPPAADEARTHRMFLLCGDVEEVDRGAPDRASQRSPRVKADDSHSPPSRQRNQQEPQAPLLAPLRSPSLTMRPRRAPRQTCPDKPAARVPVSTYASAAAARSAVPVLSISLCETSPSASARTSTRRCLNELPLNHRRIDAGFARIVPPHQLVSPPRTAAICWRLVAEDGAALVDHDSARRKASLLRHEGTHCDTAARRGPSAKESTSAAVAEAICTAAAVKRKRADSESRGAPLGTAPPSPSTAKERLATHAGLRVSAAPPVLTHVATHVASTTSAPPRRLRAPVVTWSDDVQQY
ncbi:conserved hypothetical protein [Leishmania infantum JPCM5]|uniref:Uncharacterized protein n=2 Tax=Leishmania infantum TaxID=5671 RepID=A4HW01_LEIIN|nr:conserved hypothetical protein [Leishmania infantum JPCM5]CAC9468696.1 hypothetical_protein_-_conserved [Leishmania infantum]CAM66620.1 conserved hypothetical protein [Leishmania infantum JPCM5]SUZ40289.1 hypothetical_protein_-_conserved [Leishmania infantum]|eukprot:XP_001464242.1 conserved hypothetical protein [Leishmania infantum JPCM5]